MSIFIVVFMYATWSSMFSLGKIALEHCPPLFLTASRMLLAGVLLLGFMALKNRLAFKLTLKQFLSISLLAVFSIYLTNAFEFWSLQHLTAAKTCFIYSLSPFFAALFSYFHFGEKMNGRKWLGMLVGFAGIILHFCPHEQHTHIFQDRFLKQVQPDVGKGGLFRTRGFDCAGSRTCRAGRRGL